MAVRCELTEKQVMDKKAQHSAALTAYNRQAVLLTKNDSKFTVVLGDYDGPVGLDFLKHSTMRCDRLLTGEQIWKRGGQAKASVLKLVFGQGFACANEFLVGKEERSRKRTPNKSTWSGPCPRWIGKNSSQSTTPMQ